MKAFRQLALDHVSSGCTESACSCALPAMRMTAAAYTCGHCGVEVYPRPGDLLGHEIECIDGTCVWRHRATGIEVHRCGVSELSFLRDEDLAALLG